MKQRRIAIATGISLIIMAIVAGFSIGYAYPQFYQSAQLEFVKDNIINNQGLYRNMLFGILLILILDLLVSYYLYQYFKNDNKKIAAVSGILRVIYTVLFAIATYYLILNSNTNELTNQKVSTNFQQFQSIWNVGLIVFGFHILLIGWLMKLHLRIHRILCSLTVFAGVCYVAVHLLKLTNSNESFVTNIELLLALPMAAGELGLAIWLLIKGGKEKQ